MDIVYWPRSMCLAGWNLITGRHLVSDSWCFEPSPKWCELICQSFDCTHLCVSWDNSFSDGFEFLLVPWNVWSFGLTVNLPCFFQIALFYSRSAGLLIMCCTGMLTSMWLLLVLLSPFMMIVLSLLPIEVLGDIGLRCGLWYTSCASHPILQHGSNPPCEVFDLSFRERRLKIIGH